MIITKQPIRQSYISVSTENKDENAGITMKNLKNILTTTLAVTLTTTAIAMAVASGFVRGGTAFDQALFISIAVSVTVLSHLLLALSNSKLVLVVWGGCLLATIFGQMVYFTHAAERASVARVEKTQVSDRLRSLESQIADATASRNSIISRPLAVVARDYANETEYRPRVALKFELEEAKRKIALENLIANLTAAMSTERDSEHDSISRDSLISLISRGIGVSETTLSLIVSMTFSILIELAGTTLWYELLHKPNNKPGESPVKQVVSEVSHPDEELIAKLQQAVAKGECKRTQNSIRQYLGCSQRRAGEFNKLLSKGLT
jgi:hypothetical protein